jgi:hypothetical protein
MNLTLDIKPELQYVHARQAAPFALGIEPCAEHLLEDAALATATKSAPQATAKDMFELLL